MHNEVGTCAEILPKLVLTLRFVSRNTREFKINDATATKTSQILHI